MNARTASSIGKDVSGHAATFREGGLAGRGADGALRQPAAPGVEYARRIAHETAPLRAAVRDRRTAERAGLPIASGSLRWDSARGAALVAAAGAVTAHPEQPDRAVQVELSALWLPKADPLHIH
jgi:hypothetical protein